MVNRAGFTLVEVLISFLLISIVLLCFDSAELFSIRTIRESFYSSMAVNQLHGMSERLQTLSQTQGLDEQIAIWNRENQEVLPQGRGEVRGVFPSYEITLYWGKKQNDCLRQMGCLSEKVSL